MAQITAAPNGNYTHILDVWDTGAVSGLSRLIHGRYWVDVRVSGGAGSWSGSSTRLFRAWADGQNFDNNTSFDTRSGADFTVVEFDKWVYVGGSAKTIGFSLSFQGWSSSFPAATSGTGYLTLAAVASPPSQPPAPTASNVTQTSMMLSWNDPASDGGAGYDQVILRRHPAPPTGTSGGYTDYAMGGDANSKTVTGLTPGTDYYWQLHYRNVAGYSPHGLVLHQPTAVGAAPGLSLSAAPSGQSLTVTLAPPSGMTGVNLYNIERRHLGVVTSVSSTDITEVFDGLTPGGLYEWRANAVIGSHTSPWSEWTAQIQPNPNTSPGDFFDGSMADRADTTFDWVGTPGQSKSEAKSKGVLGWAATFTAPCEGVMSHATGGVSGSKSARVAILRDATAAGQVVAGMRIHSVGRADAEGSGTYTHSIHVRTSRSQRMAIAVTWLDAAGAPIGAPELGVDQVIPASTWTRLNVTLQSPVGTEYVVVRVTDVAGAGHSNWLCGEWFQVDAVMPMLGGDLVPYFDGSTADVPEFRYDWERDANESISSRTTLTVEVTDPLADPDCPPVPLPPLPPVILSDCIEEVGSWNRYAVDIDKGYVPLFGVTIPTLILETAGFTERQVRIRFYPNPDDLPPNAVDMGAGYDGELIITFIPPNTEITLDGVTQRVWAEVNGAAPRTADHLLYGSGGTPAIWPELRCGIGYVVALDTPLEAPAGNLSPRVLLTQRV